MSDLWATCLTPDCVNEGEPVQLTDPEMLVICGPCGQPITDKSTTAPALPEEMPTWD